MLKKLLVTSCVVLGFSSSVAYAQTINKYDKKVVQELEQQIKKGFHTDADYENFGKIYNKLFYVDKRMKLDAITDVLENKYSNKKITIKKVVNNDKKALNDLYNKSLKYFGPKEKINTIIKYISLKLAYDNAGSICDVLKPAGYFKNGGKFEITVTDEVNGKTYDVLITNDRKCDEIAQKNQKVSDELTQMYKSYNKVKK